MKKKIAATILALVLIIGISVGCADNGNVVEPAPQEPAAPDNVNANVNEETPQEPVVPEELVTLDIFINHTWYPPDTFTGIIADLFRERTGVDLNVTIATSPEQLGVMIAAGDIPDLVFSSVELNRLSHPNVSMSFTYLMENHGLELSEVSQETIDIARSLSDDGDFFTLLMDFNTPSEWADLSFGAPSQGGVFFRDDLLQSIGIDGFAMTTVDEFMDAMILARDAFPDRSTFGLCGVWKFQAVENMMGVLTSQWDEAAQRWYYVASTPNYREFVEFANRMWREGLVTAEAYANQNEAESRQLAFNDQVVFYPWHVGYVSLTHLNTETSSVNPEAVWGILPPVGDDSRLVTSRGWSGLFVSRNVSDPDAAARVLTWIHSLEGSRAGRWGRYGIDYTVGDDGVPIFSEEFLNIRSEGRLDEVYGVWWYFGTTAIQSIYGDVAGLDEEMMAQVSAHGRNVIALPEVGIATPSTASDEGVILATLNELRRTHEAAIIFSNSDAEFEAAFEEFINALEASGVRRLEEYMTNAVRVTRAQLGW